MATPDSIMSNQGFNKVRATVEVRGDWVFVDMVTRFGEPLLSLHLSADEADALAGKLLDAVAAIDLRDTSAFYDAVDSAGDAFAAGSTEATFDAALPQDVPNPTFRQVVPGSVGSA